MNAALMAEIERGSREIPKGFEMIDGRLVEMKDVGAKANKVAFRLGHFLEAYCEDKDIGEGFGSDTAYRCFKGGTTGRKPDVSFVRKERLPGGKTPEGDFTIPPDLAVEVVSPNDLYYELNRKVEEYLAGKVPLVWVIDPQNRVALVYRGDGTMARVREGQELDGEGVVPGFRCPLASILPPPEHEGNGRSDDA